MAEGVAGSVAPALRAAQQAEQLAEIERARGEFLANLSHELRTPLNAILGYAEIALEHCEGDEPRILPRELVSAISRNGEALLGHVENLLQLSQLRLGRERKELVEVDLEELFHASLARARRVAFRKPIEFDLKVDPAVRRVCLDRGKVDRIIGSILTNAVKFTNRGAIQLTARPRPETGGTSLPSPPWPWERVLSVSIRDTGVGIQESDLPKIFQAFRKLDASDTSPYGGLGLGLAVSRRLTEILGGTIQVDSRPGQGSLFEILLPVQPPRTAPALQGSSA